MASSKFSSTTFSLHGFCVWGLLFFIHFLHVNDSQMKIISLTLVGTSIHCGLKGLMIVMNRENIRKVLRKYDYIYEHFGKYYDKEMSDILNVNIALIKKRAIVYLGLCYLCSIAWIFQGLIKDASDTVLARQKIEIPGFRKALGAEAWYPFVIDTYYKFIAVQSYQFLCCSILLSATYATADTFVVALNEYLSLHFQVLGKIFERIKKTSDQEMKLKLNDCIRYHQILFGLIKDVQNIIGFEAFLQCFSFLFIFCFLGFTIMNAESIDQLYGIMVYTVIFLVQVFFLTRSGNLIYDKSQEIAFCAYNSEWIGSSKHFKNAIILVIWRSQQTSPIKAGYFFTLDLETFQSLVNTSFSYITILANFV